jgi:hypothetical protein
MNAFQILLFVCCHSFDVGQEREIERERGREREREPEEIKERSFLCT